MNHGTTPLQRRTFRSVLSLLCMTAVVAGCAGERRVANVSSIGRAEALKMMARSMPGNVADRDGWVADLYAGFTVLGVEPNHENICAVMAVIEQESGFRVDPVIPGLPAIAWRAIDERAAQAGVPRLVMHGVLQLTSSTGRTYAERIDRATTERELSDIFDDVIGAVPMGRTLFEEHNPIRTRGPMQVHIVFAEQFAKTTPYPYPVKGSIAQEVFTRRGGLYFGIAHLLAYPAGYDRYLYRFADFNAGQYASRNAAFQEAVTDASGIPLTADGALLSHEGDSQGVGATEKALRALAVRLRLDEGAIHDSLEQAKTPKFEQTPLYLGVYALAEHAEQRTLTREAMPHIELHGPKITRKLTTEWYANRVDGRFDGCLRK